MTTRGITDRQRQAEWMDQPDIDEAAHRDALRGLARINRVSRSAEVLWRPIRSISRQRADPIRVLDVACGGGDVAIALQRWARGANLPITVEACDVSDVALRHARDAARRAGVPMRLFQLDALRTWPTDGQAYDVVVSSLFLHHLDREDAVRLLVNVRQAAAHVLIDDLDRSRPGLVAAYVGSRLLSRSPIVHVDAPRSVRGAFTAEEAREVAAEAGLEGASVSRRWPFRWLLRWSRV